MRLSAWAMNPWWAKRRAWLPPPELTAGPVFEETAEEYVCRKFAPSGSRELVRGRSASTGN
jgi:hypothetical protein